MKRFFSSSPANRFGFGYVNKVTLVGNVGKQPEITTTKDGKKFARFSVATVDYIKPRLASSEEDSSSTATTATNRTLWHRVVVFSPNVVDFVEKHVDVGTKVFVEGKLNHRQALPQHSSEAEEDGSSATPRTISEVLINGYQGDVVVLSGSTSGGSAAAGGGDNKYSR